MCYCVLIDCSLLPSKPHCCLIEGFNMSASTAHYAHYTHSYTQKEQWHCQGLPLSSHPALFSRLGYFYTYHDPIKTSIHYAIIESSNSPTFHWSVMKHTVKEVSREKEKHRQKAHVYFHPFLWVCFSCEMLQTVSILHFVIKTSLL